MLWNQGLLKGWSKTQPTIALSTGEAELASICKACAEGLGIQALLKDLGISVKISISSDASAAIGIASRQGLGRLRHIATADLWVQQRLKHKEFELGKVNGSENPSDLMTKNLDLQRIVKLMNAMNAFLMHEESVDADE